MLMVIIIVGILVSAISYINYNQIDQIKQNTKIDAFVSNYNQILLYCINNWCSESSWSINANSDISYPDFATWLRLQDTKWLQSIGSNSVSISYNWFDCSTNDTEELQIKIQNTESPKSQSKCFSINKKCKLLAYKCSE